MTDLLAVGLNHKTAPVELRERLAFGTDDLRAALASLRARAGLGELMVVSTCNRVEVYAAGPSWARCGELVLQALAQWHFSSRRFPPGLFSWRFSAAA